MNKSDQRADVSRSNPQLSVIIPVYAPRPESADLLRNALDHLKISDFQDFEILVADDGSPEADRISAIAREAGVQLVRLNERCGPAAARNAAARKASGEVLTFLDADTTVNADTLDRIARRFREDPQLDAVMGSYDQRPTAPGVVSRFRNLLHSFVHQRAQRRVSTFWAGCGAVRTERFQALGGFDESFPGPSIEDVEFGLRLRAAGGSIELDPRIQVRHHKRWTLTSMVETDLMARALPWAGFLRQYPESLELNFRAGERISAALAVIALLTAIVALIHGGAWWLAPVVSLAAIGLLNWPFFRFLARATNPVEALLGFPLLLIYLGTCVTGLIGGIILSEHHRERSLWPAAAVIGAILLVVQISGGAYEAEFTGHPDEAAQFVSGLMVYDYLATLPRAAPIGWAAQYYLHYPKVALGHWPPMYQAMEALLWLFTGPSRTAGMFLQWAIGVAALTVLYRLARSALPFPVAAGVVALAIAAPVFQQSLEQTMADLACLLWTVLMMHATFRLLEKQDRMALFLLALWLALAALTKGTAVCLAPVPVVALLASRERLRIPRRWVAAALGGLAAAAALVALPDVRAWGGMSAANPWPAAWIGHLAGWGFFGLAAVGLAVARRRNPLALVAGSVIVSTLGVSFVVRAMREERHWIITLPAILLLAGFAVNRLRERWVESVLPSVLAALLLVAALALFPWGRYRQTKSGNAELLAQLARPSRMLISSAEFGEGPWIAVASLAEHRPASFIVRATKVLAEEGWSGEGYHLLTTTPGAVLRRLDELALNLVILDTPPGVTPAAHHVLLSDTVARSEAWSPCGKARDLQAYCRVTPPQVPRQPLTLQVHGWDFREELGP